MPFFSQAAVDRFINNWADSRTHDATFSLSLHTADVPDLANELTAVSAPGYARQAWELGGTNNTNPPRFTATGTVTFGPATGAWPEVRSIGLRASINGARPPTGDSSLVAYHTLPDDQRFTLPNGLTHNIDRSHLYMSLPPRGAASLGWHGVWSWFDDMIGLPSSLSRPSISNSSVNLDPGGAWEANYPTGIRDSPSFHDWGDTYYTSGLIPLQFALYPRNPLIAPTSLTDPLRMGEQVYRTATLLDRRSIPWYWSPTLHALVNWTEIVTPGGDAGTATHWAIWSGEPISDTNRLIFLGEVTPAIPLTLGQGVSFGRRVVRAAMSFTSA